MPKVTLTVPVLVTLTIPEEYAGKVSREDILEMAKSAIPDSSVHPDPANGMGGCLNGVQLVVEGCCQEDEEKEPVFADVYLEHDCTLDAEDIDFEFEDEGFTKADK